MFSMKLLLTVACQLLLLSYCLSAPAKAKNNENSGGIKNIKNTDSKASKTVPKTEKQPQPKSIARKREIPDALVDHPEEFEYPEDAEDDRDTTFEIPTQEIQEGAVRPSSLDDDEREYYTSEERRKRTADRMLGRTKRNPRLSPDITDAILLDLIQNQRYSGPNTLKYDIDYLNKLTQQPWMPRGRNPYEADVLDKDIDEIGALTLLREPLPEELWSPYEQRRIVPVPRIIVPTLNRNIL